MTALGPLDPEIRTVLEDIARDPRATLFSSEPVRDVRELATCVEPIAASAVNLTKAERHLLRVHREEVAWLLRQAARRMMERSPVGRAYIVRQGLDHELRRRDRAANFSRVRSALRRELTLEDHAGVASLADADVLLETSLRIRPTCQTKISIAASKSLLGASADAIRLLESILSPRPSDDCRCVGLQWLGLAKARAGDLEGAHEALVLAMSDSEDPTVLVSWLGLSLVRGDLASAREACRRIDDAKVDTRMPVAQLRAQVQMRPELLTPKARASSRALIGESGSPSRSVLHVYE